MAGIKVPFIADVASFLRGTKDVEKALDSVGDSLDDVAREGDHAADKLERSFRDMAKDVNASTRKVSTSAKSDLDDVSAEAGQTARETAASFDGSFDSIIGGFQEVAAQAFSGLGKIGGAAGLAAAGAIGLIVAAYGKAQEAQAKLNEQADAYYQLLADAGGALDDNAKKQLEQQAIAELGDGNLYLGQKKLNELAAAGVATREQMIRLMTGELLPADYAALDAARDTVTQYGLMAATRGVGNAAMAESLRMSGQTLDQATKLLDIQERGVTAVQAQAVYAEQYKRHVQDAAAVGLVTPQAARAETWGRPG